MSQYSSFYVVSDGELMPRIIDDNYLYKVFDQVNKAGFDGYRLLNIYQERLPDTNETKTIFDFFKE
jgi:hypothetical protein